MKNFSIYLTLIFSILFANFASAEKYIIDTKGAHAFIQFKIKHLGYSWLYGRFNKFSGEFNINREDLTKSNIALTIDPSSIDSNHAERDKHLRGDDFLNVIKYPDAAFKSTNIKLISENEAIVTGNLTLHGVTKSIDLKMKLTGEGKDPWGGYRIGFEGGTKFALKDFNINYNLGPASTHVEIILSIEGIRKS